MIEVYNILHEKYSGAGKRRLSFHTWPKIAVVDERSPLRQAAGQRHQGYTKLKNDGGDDHHHREITLTTNLFSANL